jgi:hypothetical protein
MAALAATLAGCAPTGPFSEANSLLKSHVASDVTLTINESSETRHPNADGTYSVCGSSRVQQPPSLDETQRFIVSVRNGQGLGYFDGDRDPDAATEFQQQWDRLCGPNSASATLAPS